MEDNFQVVQGNNSMGIRIHKVLGWGLDDVQSENDSIINDPRFVDDINDKINDPFDVNAFLDWIKDNKDECNRLCAKANGEKQSQYLDFVVSYMLQDRDNGKSNFADRPIVYSPEYGLSHVFIVSPVHSKEYYRYDDIIDYYEDASQGGQKDRVVRLDKHCGIYPDVMMRRFSDAPFYELDDVSHLIPNLHTANKILPSTFNQLVGRWNSESPVPHAKLAEYLLKNYRPDISDEILLLTWFAKIFKDWLKTVQQLRPMIYTYWS